MGLIYAMVWTINIGVDFNLMIYTTTGDNSFDIKIIISQLFVYQYVRRNFYRKYGGNTTVCVSLALAVTIFLLLFRVTGANSLFFDITVGCGRSLTETEKAVIVK